MPGVELEKYRARYPAYFVAVFCLVLDVAPELTIIGLPEGNWIT
ncbi:hypothetical protein EC991775_1283, partial [Escherichia coli 99.1775]